MISPSAVLFSIFVAAGATDAPAPPLALLRSVLAARDLRWTIDPELAAVAAEQARAALEQPAAAGPVGIEGALRRRGLGDPWVIPVALFGDAAAPADSAAAHRQVWRIVDGVASRPGITHAAAAWAGTPDRWVLLALFSRRPVDWRKPVRQAGRVWFSGRRDPRVGDLEVHGMGPCASPTECPGAIESRQLHVDGAEVRFALKRPPGPGRWVVEVVDGSGIADPVLGWWFFDRGEAVRTFDAPGPAERWPNRVRTRAGRPPVTIDMALQAAATAHAESVCSAGRAVHGFGTGDDPGLRARAQGFEGRVAENVAVAGSLRRAFRNLLWSPSHRRLLLDPDIVRAGIAVQRSDDRACFVQLFGYEKP